MINSYQLLTNGIKESLINLHNQNLMSILQTTCIPPTLVFNPTASKGLTAGFAPMPTITYSQTKIQNYHYLSLSRTQRKKDSHLQRKKQLLLERLPTMLRKYNGYQYQKDSLSYPCHPSTSIFSCAFKKEKNIYDTIKSHTVSASTTDPFLSTTFATLPSAPASNFSISDPWFKKRSSD